MPAALPRISCLTVTLDRLVLLKEAIRCYLGQSWPERELVIVSNGDARYLQAIRRHLETLGSAAIRLVALPQQPATLGALRNLAVEAASGDIVCQWDDDDLYHPQRLQLQAEHLLRHDAGACLMTDYLQFFHREREMFWVNWTNRTDNPRHHLLPGTLMMAKDRRLRYPESGADAVKGEDDALIDRMVAQQVPIAVLREHGWMYVYGYHGNNTFSYEHHRRLAVQSASPLGFIRAHRPALVDALRHYRLPRPFVVRTADEEAFYFN